MQYILLLHFLQKEQKQTYVSKGFYQGKHIFAFTALIRPQQDMFCRTTQHIQIGEHTHTYTSKMIRKELTAAAELVEIRILMGTTAWVAAAGGRKGVMMACEKIQSSKDDQNITKALMTLLNG